MRYAKYAYDPSVFREEVQEGSHERVPEVSQGRARRTHRTLN